MSKLDDDPVTRHYLIRHGLEPALASKSPGASAGIGRVVDPDQIGVKRILKILPEAFSSIMASAWSCCGVGAEPQNVWLGLNIPGLSLSPDERQNREQVLELHLA